MGRRAVFGAILALTLVACSIGRPIREPTTYIIDPSIDAAAPPAARRPETLRVGFVRVAAPYSGSALVYRLDDVRYATDPYHAFVADPGAMLDSRIAGWLERTGPFSHVIGPGSAQSAPYVLEMTVADLYGDFRRGQPPAAVMSVQFVLIDQAATRPKVTYERTIATRVALGNESPDALVRGYGTAFADILAQLAADLARFEYLTAPNNR
jgi:cholesterol transport system auxiliary component